MTNFEYATYVSSLIGPSRRDLHTLEDFVGVMLLVRLPPDLSPLHTSASLAINPNSLLEFAQSLFAPPW